MSNAPPINIIPTANYPMLAENGTVSNVWYRWFQALNQAVAKQLPIGTIFASAGVATPVGALPCDGREVSRTVYAELFTEIGTAWGAGNGVSTFNIPLIEDFVRGTNGGFVGSKGGTDSSVLIPANLPLQHVNINDPGHSHTFVGDPHNHVLNDPSHFHAALAGADNATTGSATGAAPGNTAPALTGITIDPATATGANTVNTTGITATVGNASPTAISIVPPYAVIQWMIYTGVGPSPTGG